MTATDTASHPGILDIQYSGAWRVLDGAMDAVMTASWKWPAKVRRVYLCSLPLSLPARVLAVAGLLLVMALFYFYGSFEQWFRAIWNGRRPEF